jgi:hypothetical protein
MRFPPFRSAAAALLVAASAAHAAPQGKVSNDLFMYSDPAAPAAQRMVVCDAATGKNQFVTTFAPNPDFMKDSKAIFVGKIQRENQVILAIGTEPYPREVVAEQIKMSDMPGPRKDFAIKRCKLLEMVE